MRTHLWAHIVSEEGPSAHQAVRGRRLSSSNENQLVGDWEDRLTFKWMRSKLPSAVRHKCYISGSDDREATKKLHSKRNVIGWRIKELAQFLVCIYHPCDSFKAVIPPRSAVRGLALELSSQQVWYKQKLNYLVCGPSSVVR